METGPALLAIPQAMRVLMLARIQVHRAEIDHFETLLLEAMAVDPDPYPGDPLAGEKEYVREEVACALRVAPVIAGAKLHTAQRLVARFPDAVEAMRYGAISGYFASRLVDLTDELSDVHAAKVAERVLPRVGEQTVGQFSAAIRRAVLSVDPRNAQEKHQRAREDRRLAFNPPGDDGMINLWAQLPADQAARLEAKVDALARSWNGIDDRTMNQLRADALCALGDESVQLRANVNVTVALKTLLDLDDNPAELDGDPVTAAIARTIAFDPTGRWRRLLVDDGGRLIDVSSESYRPPAPLERFVKLRDKTCQWWGCQRPARFCEEDHTVRWLISHDTSARNLVCLCVRHHHMKHEAGWSYLRETDGTIVWTSPSGNIYKRPPPAPPPC